MKLMTSAFALSVAGLAICGAIAASASVPLAALSVAGATNTEEAFGRNQRPSAYETASASPIGYYAVHAH